MRQRAKKVAAGHETHGRGIDSDRFKYSEFQAQ